MADTPIWTGTSTFSPGQTAFGFYDFDTGFQAEADKVAHFCATRLGYPLLDVELQSGSLYTCFEEAITTYGNEVFQYKIRENYLSMEGGQTGSLFNERLVDPTFDRLIQISKNYGTEAGVGGNVTLHTGSIELIPNKQNYDLNQWAEDNDITGGIEIRKIFYEAPPAILRYFDPYAGTGTGIQSLMDAFDFGSYSPGVNFLLMPAYFDVLKVQAIEFNDQIRRSSYSFELQNNQLRIFPIPNNPGYLAFHYYRNSEKTSALLSPNTGLITNIGEVPYSNPKYSNINSVGRQWIYRYTLALAKELLGYIRGKFSTLPIPNSEVTLNQADLLSDARSEKEALITQLREILEQTSREALLERKSNESQYLRNTLNDIPLTIFVG